MTLINKSRIMRILLAVGIVIVPYIFILIAGVLEKQHVISAINSIFIVIIAGLLLIGMVVLNIWYWKKSKTMSIPNEKDNIDN